MTDQEMLSIGEVARLVGLKPSAIRFYERVGVLPEPERVNGQRRYTSETVRRLHVLGVAKRAGFSLDEAMLLLSAAGDAHEQIRELATRKLPEIEALITEAKAVRAWLQTATGCSCKTLDVCGLFDDDTISVVSGADPPPALSITQVR